MARPLPHALLLGFPLMALAARPALAQCEALQFDGVDDFATILDAGGDFDLGTAFTIEMWARIDANNPADTPLGGRTPGGGLAWGLAGGIGTVTDGVFVVSTPGTDAVSVPGQWLADGVWRHYAGSYDGVNMELFVNGVSVGQNAHSSGGPASLVNDVVLGVRATGSPFFTGALDEVRIWNVVRTPAEILQTYDSSLTGAEPGLVGYYRMDEGSGDALFDSSLAGNHGYLGATVGAGNDDPTRIVSGLPGSFDGCPNTPLGTSYCGPAIPNSTLFPGTISATGSALVLANDVTLVANDLPGGQFGYFLAGQTQGFFNPPGSQGFICLSGNIGRYNRTSEIIQGPTGSLQIDLSSIPVNPPQAVLAGESWNFQCWYRDVNPTLTSNFTDGLTILFQ